MLIPLEIAADEHGGKPKQLTYRFEVNCEKTTATSKKAIVHLHYHNVSISPPYELMFRAVGLPLRNADSNPEQALSK
jgi:hypothetical protein